MCGHPHLEAWTKGQCKQTLKISIWPPLKKKKRRLIHVAWIPDKHISKTIRKAIGEYKRFCLKLQDNDHGIMKLRWTIISLSVSLSLFECRRLIKGPRGPKECYVCYHDSTTQNTLELAFKLVFGVGSWWRTMEHPSALFSSARLSWWWRKMLLSHVPIGRTCNLVLTLKSWFYVGAALMLI